MKLPAAVIALLMLCLSGCGSSRPIDPHEMVGEWKATKRWGNRGPISGSIIFRADGTCETIKLPWGIVSGDDKQLAALESVGGKWDIREHIGKRVVWVVFDPAKSTGEGYQMSIEPKLSRKEWEFRQYIGDPDLMDIVEFKRVGDPPPR